MDKMEFRKEMYKRSERRICDKAIERAFNGDICALVKFEIDLIKEKNLIFGDGSLFTSNKSIKENFNKEESY